MKNEIEYYRDVETNERYYVVSGDLTAIDAILIVARVTHISKDKLQENRAYVTGDEEEDLFFVGTNDPIPDGARVVWAIEKRK